MASQLFPQFSLLPGELRDQIWDLSVRSRDTRGVQYFSIFSSYYGAPERFSHHLITPTSKDPIHIVGAALPATDDSSLSWTKANMSTYAIDGGLWTACKESRAAMYRRYDPVRWASFYSRQREKGRPDHESRISRYDSHKYSQMPATFIVEDDREGLRNFTVLPIYDLIFIQPWRVSPHLAYLDLDMPFSCPQYGFGGVRHLALDFDPTWNTDELRTYQKTWEDPEVDAELDPARWGVYNALVEAMQATLRLSDTTIWLVDHRLYRKSTVLTEKDSKRVFGVGRSWEKEQLVFHASDCRYYAMPDEVTWELCGYGDETLETVWGFIYELQDIAARQYALDERVPEDEVNEVWTELGVLVREKQMMEQTA